MCYIDFPLPSQHLPTCADHFRQLQCLPYDAFQYGALGFAQAQIDAEAKAQTLRAWAEQTTTPLAQTIAIGDGANDLKMMEVAALSVGFNAKPIVTDFADVAIEDDLRRAIPLLDRLLETP